MVAPVNSRSWFAVVVAHSYYSIQSRIIVSETISGIAGHVSRAMLSRYSHVRMEAKRRALDEIAARQRAADEKRKEEAGLTSQIGI